MNALLSKIGLKQKFFVIFCIVILFSVYQILWDTLIRYNEDEKRYQLHQHNLHILKQVNHFLYTMQKDIIELKLSKKESQQQKLFTLRKTEKLKNQLQSIIPIIAYDNAYAHAISELNTISKSIHSMTKQAIINKYELLYQRLYLNSTTLLNYIQNDYAHANILKTIHSDMEFVIHYLSNQMTQLQVNSFDKMMIESIDALYAKFLSYKLPSDLTHQTKINHDKLKELYTTHPNVESILNTITPIIDNYMKINDRLYKKLHDDIAIQKEQLGYHFKIKLFIELFALIVTLILLFYFYKSMFVYIKRIQNAHKIKSIFLSNMSHELRTPLNAIIGFLDILKKSQNKQERDKFIDIIYKSSKQLLYIINDILDFSKIEDAKLKIEKIPFSPKEEFKLLVELFSANASSKNIELVTQFDKNLPECITSDKYRLKQILSNLISNAIKFTQEGGMVKLVVKVVGDELYICVEDNGIGISPTAQKQIFKSFLQAKNSTSRKYGGTGLGLSICSKLVRLLGSKLKVESKEFYGSKFYFYLPIVACRKQELEAKVKTNVKTYEGKVLLVEDNATNQYLMQITFSNLKLDVVVANDGNEAIEHFKNSVFDMIFMDDNMPNKSGVEATQEIRAYEKEHNLEPIPIIALTANTDTQMKRKFFKAGMNEFMPKPFDIELLHQILQKYLT